MSVDIAGARVPATDDGLEVLTSWGGRQGTTVRVPVGAVHLSDSPRSSGENTGHVRTLAEVDGPLPPIIVHRQTMSVIDGMHRLLAARARGDRYVEVRFFDGDPDDAFVLAVTLNTSHGLPLSRGERAAAVLRIMRTHARCSDRSIALITGLSDKTVAAIRRSTADIPPLNARVGRDGRTRPSDGAQGRLRARDLIAARPDASLREIAAEAGVALATARDVRRRLARGEDPLPPRQRAAVPHPRTGEPPVPRRPAARRDGPPRAADGNQDRDRDLALVMHNLRRDPSLRLSEAGRTLLRLLDAHAIPDVAWDRLAEQVPAHCAPHVVQAARECAAAWQRFAEVLDGRDQ
jgi:ParB-like chromosome segregation protein Spo0J